MRIEVRKGTFEDAVAYYGQHMHHYMAECDGVAIAMGTLTRINGRLWGYLDVRENLSRKQGVALVRTICRNLDRLNETVYVAANDGVHAKAEKLIKACGFHRTDMQINDKRVWVWQS